MRVGIVVSDFNGDITSRLLHGATTALRKYGVVPRNITVVHVPGGFEIPLACQRLARTKKFDALVALGCVIKGATDHYYYIAGEASRGIMRVMLDHGIPIGFGVLTTHTLAQARARSSQRDNAGRHAVEAALVMALK